MIENLTSDKKTGYPKKFWIIFAVCFSILFSIPFLHRFISEQTFNRLLALYCILFVVVFIYTLFGAYCKKCGTKVKRTKITVPSSEVEEIVERFNLKKPFQYPSMLKSKADWEFWINTCKKCNYHQVITFNPKNWG